MALAVEIEERVHPVEPPNPPADCLEGYERFSEAPVWKKQRAYDQERGVEAWRKGEVPHYITSTPGMAGIYADMIVRYWEAALTAGDLDPEKPLYVLDLGAGCGRFTYLLLKTLQNKLARSWCAHLRPCYLASDIVESNLDFVASHPYLKPYVESGQLDTVLWDAEQGGALHLRAQRRDVLSSENPMVVVANHVFGGLTHDLFGFHYGRMFEGRVAPATNSGANGDAAPGSHDNPYELEYKWQAINGVNWLPGNWQPLLGEYAARLDSASVLLPSGAMRCLDHLAQLTGGRYFLLSSDHGVFTEQQLRIGDSTDMAVHGRFSLRVNYHALSSYQHAQEAWVWNGRHRENGLVFHLALRTRKAETYQGHFQKMVECLDRLNPDDYYALKKVVEAVTDRLEPEQLLTVLRLGHYDHRILAAAIEPLLAKLSNLTSECCWLWRDALERTWANYFPLGESDPFYFNFSLVAMHVGHWGLAKEGLRLGLALYGDDVATLHHLAYCEASTGHAPQALASVKRSLALDSDNKNIIEFKDLLIDRLCAWNGMPWYRPDAACDGELTLEPLGVEHADSLFYQYRDPQIGVMTRLPELKTLDEATDWVKTQASEPGCVCYAVMHDCWGFIGAVSMRFSADAGYFCFWIGADYQGVGFGRRAARLLFAQAERSGIQDVFTSVYRDNVRSLRAMAHLGFAEMQAAAEPPDEDLVFFHRSLLSDSRHEGGDWSRKLQRLSAAIESPIVFRG